ncbi:MAG: 4-(cytidine 5'-diphospho)-2-C-methyl-D-erythritol kinase [Candidatus Caenarcaniphilales bacterium]|nr:4-(cytidine 5'-diphospho)-2-C-methyl-D-erythritol kinase [Candidatus Caenarcaniphilales bacterium]
MIIKAGYQEKAPAKINLYLNILDKKFYPRDDGYHNLKTVFQAIDLCDELTVEFEALVAQSVNFNYEIEFKSNSKETESFGDDNLINRATKLYFERMNPVVLEQIRVLKIFINLNKKIPIQAGLGGGSANAGAMLRVLDQYFTENYNYTMASDLLEELALELGSDVPFCLNSVEKPRRYAEGRGEKFSEPKIALNPKEMSNLVIIKPDFGIETAKAYEILNRHAERARMKKITGLVFNKDPALMTMESKETISELFNNFEEALFPEYPVLSQIRDTLKSRLFAKKVLLSGSGSTMLAFYPEDIGNLNNLYRKAKEIYEPKNYSVFKCKFLDPC